MSNIRENQDIENLIFHDFKNFLIFPSLYDLAHIMLCHMRRAGIQNWKARIQIMFAKFQHEISQQLSVKFQFFEQIFVNVSVFYVFVCVT